MCSIQDGNMQVNLPLDSCDIIKIGSAMSSVMAALHGYNNNVRYGQFLVHTILPIRTVPSRPPRGGIQSLKACVRHVQDALYLGEGYAI